MKDRLRKISKKATYTFCLLAACGLTYSCADEYKLDDEAPSFLGKSIYDELKGRDGFTTMLRLIDDLGEKETLSKTGSRTLFASPDSAFTNFFEQNKTNPSSKDWANATCYDSLTAQQKRLLLNVATLNNAYLMEMLPNAQGNPPSKGINMRKETLLGTINTVEKVTEFKSFKDTTLTDYWKEFRESGEPLYLVSDNTTPMLVFFTPEQMSKANIQDEDFEFIMDLKPGTKSPNDSYVYGNKVVEKDITCQNGYIHILDNVLLPPGNMAEVIRTNGETDIFSHILERFSAPYYNTTITQNYKDVYGGDRKVYVKKYFSNNTSSAGTGDGYEESFTETADNVSKLAKGPDMESPSSSFGALKFDPAWNQYVSTGSGATATSDMAAMFVPNDNAMIEYFKNGTGRELINKYGDPSLDFSIDNKENLYYNIDQIPMSTINALVNNLMQSSFTNSVPSKFDKVLNSANDNLFADINEAKGSIDKGIVANNGVVYLMKKVYAPVDYTSVASPAFLTNKDFDIMKFAIFSGSTDYMQGKDNMGGIHFYAYLRAMKSKFTVFMPTDEALKYYIDPLSYGFTYVEGSTTKPRVMDFAFDASADMPVSFKSYPLDESNGTKGTDPFVGMYNKYTTTEIANRLEDILESHTIVHGADEPEGIFTNPKKQYYLSKSGAPIRLTHNTGNPTELVIQGGMQIERGESGNSGVMPGFYQVNVDSKYSANMADVRKENGWTYCITAPIAPSVKSVHMVLKENGENEDAPFHEFYELCQAENFDLLKRCGILQDGVKQTEKDKYLTFISSDNGLDQSNVSFFSNFNYTVYIPTNEAIRNAVEKQGLPTWESIKEYIDLHESDDDWDSYKKYVAQEQIYCLINFIRGHFQDNSIFVDYVEKNGTYETSTLNDVTNKFVTLNVEQIENKITVTSANGDVCTVTDDADHYNLIARDYKVDDVTFSGTPDLKGSTIAASSYAVIHQIEGGVLNFVDLSNYGNSYKAYYEAKAAESSKNLTSKIRVRNK